MPLTQVKPGEKAPHETNVVIEIQTGGSVKYEVDERTGHLVVDRFLSTAMYYPCNYGFVPQTSADDDDPVDVLVVTPQPLQPGCVICCRPVGMLPMRDGKEGGDMPHDNKIIAVPISRVTREYDSVKTYSDLPQSLLDAIAHFFRCYKDNELGKVVTVGEWQGVEAAKEEIQACIDRYAENQKSATSHADPLGAAVATSMQGSVLGNQDPATESASEKPPGSTRKRPREEEELETDAFPVTPGANST